MNRFHSANQESWDAVSPYDRGPHHFDRSDEVPDAEEGSLSGYEFHWTVSDFVSALLDVGCELLLLDEIGHDLHDWEAAPLKMLPENLLAVGRKRGDSSETSSP